MATRPQPSTAEVRDWLSRVPDPEIPVISLTDLGIIRDVAWDGDTLVVTVTPTYSGCPATAIIDLDIEKALRAKGIGKLRLKRRISPPWTTDWISAEGREKLKAYGIAPPGRSDNDTELVQLMRARQAPPCPYCDSRDTEIRSEFGSTACKSVCWCRSCKQPFEEFKAI